MGFDKCADKVYIVDFGLSKPYCDLNTGKHIELVKNKRLTGTARYASINTHTGFEQSRRDDLESLGYTLIYLIKGHLPWQGIQGTTKKERRQNILKSKMKTSIEKLCNGLPNEFAKYLRYCRRLEFEERPDYHYLKSIFRDCFEAQGFDRNSTFDWNNKNIKIQKEPQRSISFDFLTKPEQSTQNLSPAVNPNQKKLSFNYLKINFQDINQEKRASNNLFYVHRCIESTLIHR